MTDQLRHLSSRNAQMGKCYTASEPACQLLLWTVLGPRAFCRWHPKPMPTAPDGERVGSKSMLGQS